MNDVLNTKLEKIIKNDSIAGGIAVGFGLTNLISDRKEFTLTSGRLITSAFQKRFQQQLVEEILGLAEKGGWKDKPYDNEEITGIFLLLQKEIEENPDEVKRLKAMKALFIGSISKLTNVAELIMIHQLTQKAKHLTSMDLIVLKTCYFKVYKNNDPKHQSITYANQWRSAIVELNNGGGDFLILVGESEKRLIEQGLLNDALGVTKETVQPGINFRLSDLGISLCKYLEKFEE